MTVPSAAVDVPDTFTVPLNKGELMTGVVVVKPVLVLPSEVAVVGGKLAISWVQAVVAKPSVLLSSKPPISDTPLKALCGEITVLTTIRRGVAVVIDGK